MYRRRRRHSESSVNILHVNIYTDQKWETPDTDHKNMFSINRLASETDYKVKYLK